MTYEKQLEQIYDWYWFYNTKLYTAWEDFLDEKYYGKNWEHDEPPRIELFILEMFETSLKQEKEEIQKQYTCFPLLWCFVKTQGLSYKKKIKNLKNPIEHTQIFPSLLRHFYRTRKKMGHQKFLNMVGNKMKKITPRN